MPVTRVCLSLLAIGVASPTQNVVRSKESAALIVFRLSFALLQSRMARRPDSEKHEKLTQKDLGELRYNLAHLSVSTPEPLQFRKDRVRVAVEHRAPAAATFLERARVFEPLSPGGSTLRQTNAIRWAEGPVKAPLFLPNLPNLRVNQRQT